MCSVTPLLGGQILPPSAVNPTTYNVSSVLDSRLRREARRTRFLINNARLNLIDYDKSKESDTQVKSEVMKPETKILPKTFDTPSEEIAAWLESLNNFDQRYIPGQGKFSVLESNVSKTAAKFDPISAVDDEFYEYSGGKDKDGECHGNGYLEYDDGSYLSGSWIHGVREGHFRFDTCHPKSPVLHLEGDYKNDELTGRARMQLKDETWMEGWFKESVLHGFCRKFDKNHQLSWVGMFRNGQPVGVCWQLMPLGGCVVGHVNEDGLLSGSNIAYIYPDNVTALVGQFLNCTFVRGSTAVVEEVKEQYGCIKVPQFKSISEPVYIRELSSLNFVTSQPLLRDPYEDRMVDVRQSLVEGAEEGLFSKLDVKAGTVMAFYNGIRCERPKDNCGGWQLGANAYKIFDPTNKNGTVDIPEEFRSLENYSASLAHKTNHSFIPNCEFNEFHHPRFGLVPCIQAIHDIAAGEEIFVWYGYDLDYCPEWYMEAWAKGNFAIPESMKREYGEC